MNDQINRLASLGIKSVSLNSLMGVKDTRQAYKDLIDPNTKLLYIAPETLMKDDVLSFLKDNCTVSFIAVDECHVVSFWGNSFRPSYRRLGQLKTHFPNIPFAALTATLSTQGIEDVIKTLGLSGNNKFIHNLDRPSINYNIHLKLREHIQILDIVKKYGIDKCGIIYCSTVKKTLEIAQYLNSKGFKCDAFNSKISKADKTRILTEYMSGQSNLIVATIAFGMGLDRADVRYVIHTDAPANIENYMQETGRLSRDGLPSEAYLLYDSKDINFNKRLLTKSIRDKVVLNININKINQFKLFCESKTCRRIKLLSFFDQTVKTCGNCDICLNHHTIPDRLKYLK